MFSEKQMRLWGRVYCEDCHRSMWVKENESGAVAGCSACKRVVVYQPHREDWQCGEVREGSYVKKYTNRPLEGEV